MAARKPPSPLPQPSVAGIDVGRKQDCTAVVTISGRWVTGAWRLPIGVTWRQLLFMSIDLVNHCSDICVDATGIGDAFVENLRDSVPGRVHAIQFSAPTKRLLIENLVSLLQHRRIQAHPKAPGIHMLTCELANMEATTGRTGWRYSGKRLGTDDLVMALALACNARQPVAMH